MYMDQNKPKKGILTFVKKGVQIPKTPIQKAILEFKQKPKPRPLPGAKFV